MRERASPPQRRYETDGSSGRREEERTRVHSNQPPHGSRSGAKPIVRTERPGVVLTEAVAHDPTSTVGLVSEAGTAPTSGTPSSNRGRESGL